MNFYIEEPCCVSEYPPVSLRLSAQRLPAGRVYGVRRRRGIHKYTQTRIRLKPGDILFLYTDGGKPYDPTARVANAEDYDIETQIGGLGKLIAFTVADN